MADFKTAYLKLRTLEGYYTLEGGVDSYAGINRSYFPDERIWHYVDAEKPLKQGQKLKNGRAESIIEVFYYTHFWRDTSLSILTNDRLATFVFCESVNMGDRCVKILQGIVGTVQDGILGHKTTVAANDFDGNLIHPLSAGCEAYYRTLCEENPSKRKYLSGWLNRIALLS